MRRYISLAILLILGIIPALVSQSNAQGPPFPDRDPQAVALLNQSVANAGGAQAINAIHDFTATGNITYFWTEKGETGAVTVKSRGTDQFRLDAAMNDGVITAVVDKGIAWNFDAKSTVQQPPNQHTDNAGCLYFPYEEIVNSLADKFVGVTDLGMVTENGQQAHGIRLQRSFPGNGNDDSRGTRAKRSQRDFFIDPTTLMVVRTGSLSTTRSDPEPRIQHEVVFSNYQQVNGVLFPFSVGEYLNHQSVATLKFDQVQFNTGLSDADFKK